MTMFGSQWLANPDTGYEISQSIRFNDNDSAYLNRTFGSAGNRKTYTFSGWFKRGNILGANTTLALAVESGGNNADIHIESGEVLRFRDQGNSLNLITNQVFRDPSAWFHLVAAVDTTQSTASNRAKLYLNGSQITSFSTETYMAQDSEGLINSADNIEIGRNPNGSVFWDGYMAELVFIDGQALTPASLGETNNDGVWIPKNPSSLTFGTNGYYLKGQDSSALGDDTSGNGNDFSSSGLAAADQVTDSPTNNMPTLNSLSTGTGALSDGNLQYTGVSGNWSNSRLTLLVPDTGKWAIRMKSASSYQQIIVGLCAPDSACPYTDIDVNDVVQIRYNTQDGNFVTRVGGSLVNDTGAPTTAAQTFFQLLFDMDNGKLGVAADDATSGTFADISTYSALDLNGTALKTARQPFVQAFAGTDANAGVIIDVGQSGWTTTVTGFKNLILANLDTPSIKDGSAYFQPKIYTGSTSAQDITFSGNSDLAPDWLWFKARSASDHFVFDRLRGVLKTISTNDKTAEVTSTGSMTAFGADGFSLGDGGSDNDINGVDGTNYVVWGWAANGSGSSNEDGSINTTATSANTTAGFSISTYTGTGSGATVGHGLGVKPSVVLVKCFGTASTHWVINDWSGDYSNKLKLNENEAASSSSGFVTAASSTTFTLGTDSDVNGSSRTYVAYCFAEIPGYSQISSYTGNNDADGPFVYTDFAPAYVLWKNRTTAGNHWVVADRARSPGNVSVERLFPDLTNAESTSTAMCDFLSNGFKIRSTMGEINTSGDTIIYMAFAENPFGGGSIPPVTAR
jgi:hypothetical protein